MNSVDLQFFCAVASSGGMGKAASQLNTVQSNVTAHIRKLEEELGVPLFYRASNGVTLTSAGERLLPFATHASQLFSDAKRAVVGVGEPMGELNIGSMETTAALRLPAIFSRYLHRFPEVDLHLTTGPTEDLIARVLTREIEGAFVSAPIVHPELTTVSAFEEQLVFIAPAYVTHEDGLRAFMQKQPGVRILVFRSGCSYRQRLERFLSTKGIVDIRRMELGTLDGIIGCVSAGMGISLIPRVVAEAAMRFNAISIHPMPANIGTVETLFVYRNDTFLSAALQSFIAGIGSVEDGGRLTLAATGT
ncbi:MAG: transcriptional regulator, LysR family [Pseudomonas sp.]|nr:transcriptional regulator, LysR family [Pseudomonas sp.]